MSEIEEINYLSIKPKLDKKSYRLKKRSEENSTHPNLVDETIRNIYCYKIKEGIYFKMLILNILTAGIIQLCCYFSNNIYLYLYCNISEPKNCDYFEIYDKENKSHIVKSKKENFCSKNKSLLLDNTDTNINQVNDNPYIQEEIGDKVIFYYKQNKYIYNESEDLIEPVVFNLSLYKNSQIHGFFENGMPDVITYNYLLNKFRKNVIFMKDKSFFLIFFEQILNIQYIYQMIMVVIWFSFEYYSFAAIVIFFSLLIVLINSINTGYSYKKILQFAHHDLATIIRGYDLIQFLKKKKIIRKPTEKKIYDNKNYNESGESEGNNEAYNDADSNKDDFLALNADKISSIIVPGDILEISINEILCCDCVLLDGCCTVNEADLTGESSLVMKSALPNDDKFFSYYLNKKAILFHGTKISQCESNLASGNMRVMAINTGFNTNRGNLIQNILFPRKTNAKFYIDSLYFVISMIVIYIISSIFFIIVYNYYNYTPDSYYNEEYRASVDIGYSIDYNSDSNSVYKAYDILKVLLFNLVIIMPPTLPICTTFTSFYFQYNLKKKRISCVEDSKMTIAGRINTIVLDKTGTLTEEGLELYGFQNTIISFKRIQHFDNSNSASDTGTLLDYTEKTILQFDEIELSASIYNMVLKDFYKRLVSCKKEDSFINDDDYRTSYKYNMIYFLECLASCHSIDILKGRSFGNSVDKKIFENLEWMQVRSEYNGIGDEIQYDIYPKNSYKITEDNFFNKSVENISENRRYKLTVVKRFEFSSKYQSMSVIVLNNLDQKYRFFIKGAPERIMQHCNPESLPEGFNEKLLEHTKTGYRVLAAATKALDFPLEEYGRLTKDEDRFKFENKLTFLGLIIFKNKLKKDTKHVIQKLNQSNCRIIMATGDNPFTSISVSRECELLKEDDKIYLFDLDRDGKNEKLKLQFINQGRNDSDDSIEYNPYNINNSNNNIPLSDRSDTGFVNKNKNNPKEDNRKSKRSAILNINNNNLLENPNSNGISENNIQPVLDKIKNEENCVLCISGKCFEYLINKYIEEQEVSLTAKNDKTKTEKNIKSKSRTLSRAEQRSSIKKLTLFKNDSYKHILDTIFLKGKIFFRMSPNNKVLLVDFLKKDEKSIVAMCGDGANDCGALLAADIGISLCNKIGNNVTSHFYSKDGSISCIELILRNGRACYENSTIIFKYMIMYSIILLSTVFILFFVEDKLNNNHFLFIDFFLSMVSCLLSSKTGPGYNIEKSPVKLSIINFKFIIIILGHIFIEVILQVCLIYIVLLNNFKDYQNSTSSDNGESNNLSSFIFVFTCFQYIFMLFVFNSTSKHRKDFYANKLYIFYTSLMIFYISSLVSSEGLDVGFISFGLIDFGNDDYKLTDIMEIKKLICLMFIVGNIILTTLYELLINYIIK